MGSGVGVGGGTVAVAAGVEDGTAVVLGASVGRAVADGARLTITAVAVGAGAGVAVAHPINQSGNRLKKPK